MYGKKPYIVLRKGTFEVSQIAKEKPAKRAPRRTQTKEERLEARLTVEDKLRVSQAAELSGVTLTNFVTTAAREAADRVLQDRELIRLSEADREVVLQVLLNPRPLNAKLQAAARRHDELFGS